MMTPRRRNYSLERKIWRFADTAVEIFRRVIDPQESFFLLAICVIAVSLDPLFLYIPVINDHEKCFQFDRKLRIAALVLRSVTDAIFVLHIVFQLCSGFAASPIPDHRDGVKERVASSWEMAKTYMASYFLIDVLSLLPVPQVIMLSIIPEMKGSKSLVGRDILVSLVLLQYVPRVVRIYPLYNKLKSTPRIFKGHLWTKAAFNLFLYMLASHVLGAWWYFLSIEREITCWQQACEGHPGCDHSSFFCNDGIRAAEFLHDMCPIDTPNTDLFDFGIFLDALQSGIVESVNFPQKLFRCLWWGLQNLSSLGQNLKTSTYVWENIFAVFISTSGLVLFLYFIGNMQTYMQLKNVKKLEKRMEIRSKVQAVDSWMRNNCIPERIQRRIKNCVEKKWHEIKTVDAENLIPILPMDLQKDIKRFFWQKFFVRVPVFAMMDDQLLDAMCARMKPMFYSKESYILRKGDPMEGMCFIFWGNVLSRWMDTHVSRTNLVSSVELKAGDFCGEELLTWALNIRRLTNLPIANETAQAETEVEAFVVTTEDLKFLISKLWLQQSDKLRQTFRHYSSQWKKWAAYVIQRAWRRFSKRKLEESLREEAIRLQEALVAACGTSTSIGATFYLSRFTANAVGLIRGRKFKEADIITAMHLQKPADAVPVSDF